MESEKLIEAVKQRPILFENNRRSYKDAEKKDRHLAFRVSSTAADVNDMSIESGNPENPDIAFRTACLSVVKREI